MGEYADGPVYGQQSKAVRGLLLRKREGELMEWGGAEDLRDCGLSHFGDPLDFSNVFWLDCLPLLLSSQYNSSDLSL